METSTRSSKGPSKRIDWAISLVGVVLSAILGFAGGYILQEKQATEQVPGDKQKIEEMRKTNAELKSVNTHLDSLLVGTKEYAKQIVEQSQLTKSMLTDLRKNPTSDSSAANRLFDNVSSRIEAIADASTEIAKYTGVTTPIVIKKPSAITGDQVIEIPRMNKSKGGGVTGRAFDRYHSVGVVEEIEGNKILAVIDGSTYYMNAGGRQTINDDSLGPIQVIYTGLEGGKYGFEIAHQK